MPGMAWQVEFDDEFYREFQDFDAAVQDELLALTVLLEQFGPALKRPHADTLKASKHANMRELRFRAAGGEWRIAYAFDPKRRAILLVGGNKSGGSQQRFYKTLIRTAGKWFDDHLARLSKGREGD